MSHVEALTKYVGHFVDQLYQSGVIDIVISPGSRSTPLSLSFAAYERFNVWVDIDERSAGFFALGMAKETNKAVVLVCSSGTAAANYFPAIIEAAQSRVPLIVLTADRPHELRDVGAAQAIDQLKMYGNYPKWFHEMALPDASPQMLQYARNNADRAVQTAASQIKGPVHLNFPFREPLIPDFELSDVWFSNEQHDTVRHFQPEQTNLSDQHLDQIKQRLQSKKRGLIICGPHDHKLLANAVLDLAEAWGLPVLGDPLSFTRMYTNRAVLIESYDSILKNKKVRGLMKPDFIIRFGAMPVAKPVLQLLQEQDIDQLIVDDLVTYRNPTQKRADYLYGQPEHVAKQLATLSLHFDQHWLTTWQHLNQYAKSILQEAADDLTEGLAVRGIQSVIPNESILFVGNSMPIRDVDSFWFDNEKQVPVYANRGANGIDGVVSTAMGMAASGKRVTLLVGDISFLHSMNGLLLTKQYDLSVTVVLINNKGGGIFSFLPQAQQNIPHYELLFGTPQQLDMKKVAHLYDLPYENVTEYQPYLQALHNSYHADGVSLIEVQTDRQENVNWHQAKWQQIEQYTLSILKDNTDVYL
ncbi:2-succinyl-5-enolpyruvyl-6-hydroxy-3-cyclohexene-1-carboxylic-acid synthase [Gracilibacillus caseinilyticus]|uniref:2-succinyl-5-enolpyruvyl-6-hydroxy-3-cyclohexene-1-carboxylate synthase n=1 Tax=Gracilibacillus caseinilyticus TaxID=2932256 RepID=A0ABY4EUL3_9BACI|nr:2-succinyl-5-enolpyruvyl-6-hydroxy-3-cyclohexene-1-carboxylic-acid synthase [Gracilibacillus caseinilyticus]UOQ48097.1 2-succinyl-5-enolpyruvyl-6-hydroxy-3-cyclohexene-1-carboxylic-acid synthase [Gracilibacillus caseinilyticus]